MLLQYSVVQQFIAKRPISGAEREFQPGETLFCDTSQKGATVTIEFEKSPFIVDRVVFNDCCEIKNEGSAFF